MVSIIYVNYNTIDLISDSIKTIINKVIETEYEIIVVDNYTQDLTSLKNIYPPIKIVQLNENVGFGRANNKGADIASGDYLLFLNPDTLLINDAVTALVNAFKFKPNTGVAGGNLYDETGAPMHSYYWITLSLSYIIRSIILPKSFYTGMKYQFNFSSQIKEVGYTTGADLMICKHVFDEVGGFSSHIFMYYEDVDLCHKVKGRGYSVINTPHSKIKHLEGKSIPDTDPGKTKRKKQMNIEGQAWFLNDNYNRIARSIVLNTALFLLSCRKSLCKITGKKTDIFNIQYDYFKSLKKQVISLCQRNY